jgi:hypothetical protein
MSPQLGAADSCYQSTWNITGMNCGNFATGRTMSVNSKAIACGSGSANFTLPAKVAGGFCFQISAGGQTFAYFSTF